MADEKPIYEYTIIARSAGSTKEHIDRKAIAEDPHAGIVDLEGKPGGARTASEAAAEGSMILQEKLGLKPIARDK